MPHSRLEALFSRAGPHGQPNHGETEEGEYQRQGHQRHRQRPDIVAAKMKPQ